MIRTIFNQKGGVGKTSITCNLAASFALMGRKTLVIDLDSQCNATQYILGDQVGNFGVSIADFFQATLSFTIFNDSLEKACIPSAFDNLWLIPGSPLLSDLQTRLESKYKVLKLYQSLKLLVEKNHFDEVLIDTPPALNFYAMSALIASQRVLIPYDCDAFSAKALKHVCELVNEVANDYKPDLEVEGIIINQFVAQARLPKDTVQDLTSSGYNLLSPFLSSSVALKESHAFSKPLVYLKPKHKLSGEFKQLASHIVKSVEIGDRDGSKRSSPYKSKSKSNPRPSSLRS